MRVAASRSLFVSFRTRSNRSTLPGRLEPRFWWAVALVTAGGEERVRRSLPLFETVFAADRSWAELLGRLPASGLLPDDPELLESILSVSP